MLQLNFTTAIFTTSISTEIVFFLYPKFWLLIADISTYECDIFVNSERLYITMVHSFPIQQKRNWMYNNAGFRTSILYRFFICFQLFLIELLVFYLSSHICQFQVMIIYITCLYFPLIISGNYIPKSILSITFIKVSGKFLTFLIWNCKLSNSNSRN